ncbi:serine/threonine-protein kinase [Pseudomonas donghuensis]|uniref:serine/threonine-protein kinase n=1 Tax=Pseudomonas donghuensis TaxID=1163398 RepID=UPI000C2ABA13|nr:serine/threonine-protein kinase [Pseudomonas donghuensis]PJY97000.1 hypothetical protein COO64_09240 [Pseudomonas donghuensis]WKY30308.1 serine/threonine-protein kinase [Pseudomonas donghuensis]
MLVIRQIGRGGFGNVDLVQDTEGNQYARKTFSINQGADFPLELTDNVKRRFVREAQVQAALNHKNIMPVLSSNLTDNPPSFLMPLASASLYQDIQYDRSLNGNAMQAIMDILAGLEELHSIDITHRDLKPQNVLRISSTEGDRYVISDFGLISVKDTQLSVLTQTGMRMGSDYYTAPEIVGDLRMASAQSDIYSVGCILHDLFGEGTRIPCFEIKESGPFSDIMLCCTRREPSRRFGSVADLREAIIAHGQINVTATEPQVADFITLLSSEQEIDLATWERIINKIEDNYPSQDVKNLLQVISLNRINDLIARDQYKSARLGIMYAQWVGGGTFDFSSCDGIANRLQAFMAVPDLTCQADVLVALLLMGTSHNRWYVERKFAALCNSQMEDGLARRLALELRVLGRQACAAITHLEDSIHTSRNNFHPTIVTTLNQVC